MLEREQDAMGKELKGMVNLEHVSTLQFILDFILSFIIFFFVVIFTVYSLRDCTELHH